MTKTLIFSRHERCTWFEGGRRGETSWWVPMLSVRPDSKTTYCRNCYSHTYSQ